MSKIPLIIQREYITRVRKPAFLAITILGPLLIAGLIISSVYFATQEQKHYSVAVVDSSGLTSEFPLHPSKYVSYKNFGTDALLAKKGLATDSTDIVLLLPANLLTTHAPYIILRHRNEPGLIAVSQILADVSDMRDRVMYQSYNINVDTLESLRIRGTINIVHHVEDKNGNVTEKNSNVSAAMGFAGAMIMYVFIFLYGVQVMRGVMEEKTNRIVEVVISSVRPFQLMMGKIIGVALVGLTQFLLWVVLTFGLVMIGKATVLKNVKLPDVTNQQQDPMRNLKMGSNVTELKTQLKKDKDNAKMGELFNDLAGRDLYFMLGIFLFYFMGGYLLYSALFAAVGSAVDSETDVQQFMLPITAPIIFSIAMASAVMTNPNGSLAVWLSIIPFTSPVTMMIRLPFIEPGWQLALSMLLLVLGFVFTTWLAGKIYRTGILMYGKKTSWKELWKWLFYKA